MVFLSQLPIFDKDGGKDGHLDDGDEDHGDLSDSEESLFSGLKNQEVTVMMRRRKMRRKRMVLKKRALT